MNHDRARVAERNRDTCDRDIPPGWKRCANPACRRIKPLSAFWRNRNNPDGFQARCTVCMKALNLACRVSDRHREWTAAYNARPENRARKRAYAASEAGARTRAAYRSSPKGKLTAARKVARVRLRGERDAGRRADLRALVRLYDGCLAALDPADGRPVPAGAKRCPGCQAPKPLRGWFYADRSRPDGFSDRCRACAPQTRAERVAANHRHYAATKRAGVVACLRGARRRLKNATSEASRDRLRKTIEGYEAELRRDAVKAALKAEGRKGA